MASPLAFTIALVLVYGLVPFNPVMSSSVNAGGLDLNNPFAFLMFENFELCRKVFNEELSLIQQLRDTRNFLANYRDTMKTQSAILTSADARNNVLRQTRNVSDSCDEDFPSQQDFHAAVNAMVTLQNTYLYDPYELSRGKMSIENFAGIAGGGQLVVEGAHNLTWRDLYSMALVSKTRRWFDSASLFLRAAFQLIPEVPKKTREVTAFSGYLQQD